jgi:hypothetical protein
MTMAQPVLDSILSSQLRHAKPNFLGNSFEFDFAGKSAGKQN